MHCKSYSHFFSKKFQHICVSLDANFNESLTNDVVSFEQLGPDLWILPSETRPSKGTMYRINIPSPAQPKLQIPVITETQPQPDWHSYPIDRIQNKFQIQHTASKEFKRDLYLCSSDISISYMETTCIDELQVLTQLNSAIRIYNVFNKQ